MKWLREMFSGTNQRISSKRVVGALITVAATATICFTALTDPTFPAINSLLEFVLITGGTLLGVGIAEKKWNSKTEE